MSLREAVDWLTFLIVASIFAPFIARRLKRPTDDE